MEPFKRDLNLKQALHKKSVLLLGPRRTGKTFLIKRELRADAHYDLLQADTFRELSVAPELIRQRIGKATKLIVIDEIQKLPKGLKLLNSHSPLKRQIVVAQEKHPRRFDGIEIMPVANFLRELWAGNIV